MICGGDEIGRTQLGNNNGYCQDNELSWTAWELTDEGRALLEFTRKVARIRREHPTFRRRKFFRGREIRGSEVKDLAWFQPVGGREMTDQEWNAGFVRCFGMAIGGRSMEEWNERGEQIADDDFILLFNADGGAMEFTIPEFGRAKRWSVVLDTNEPDLEDGARRYAPGESVPMEGRSMVVLQAIQGEK